MTAPDELSWLAPIGDLDLLEQARTALVERRRVALSGPTGPARALLPLLITEPPLLVIVPRERDVDQTADDLRTLAIEAGLAGQ